MIMIQLELMAVLARINDAFVKKILQMLIINHKKVHFYLLSIKARSFITAKPGAGYIVFISVKSDFECN